MIHHHRTRVVWLALGLALAVAPLAAHSWPFDVHDLRGEDSLAILVFGDAGTGEAGQFRVGHAMYEVCQRVGCDLALTLGDNIYENGIEIDSRDDATASLQEILKQFDEKFERPYAAFRNLPGMRFWVSLGNHDYRRNAVGSMVTYSEFSDLWRLPALHYEVPLLPPWIQIHAVHTDTDERRDLNGLQVEAIRRRMCADTGVDRWKVLFGHQPVYNSGHHRNDGNERRARALLETPLIQACGIHFYFAGHAHHQEHLTVRGFEQVIQAAAGKSKGRNAPRRSARVQQRFFSQTFGFGVLTIDATRARLDFYEVLNTEEDADPIVLPSDDEIVRSYSWCGTRDEVGMPSRPPSPCPARAVPTATTATQ